MRQAPGARSERTSSAGCESAAPLAAGPAIGVRHEREEAWSGGLCQRAWVLVHHYHRLPAAVAPLFNGHPGHPGHFSRSVHGRAVPIDPARPHYDERLVTGPAIRELEAPRRKDRLSNRREGPLSRTLPLATGPQRSSGKRSIRPCRQTIHSSPAWVERGTRLPSAISRR